MQDNDQDQDENALSDLYAELSQEQPSTSLDDKILAEAHKAVEPVVFAKKASGPFSGQWTVPVSLAAVIVLSVTVVVMIEKKRPYSLTSTPEQTRVEQMADSRLTELQPSEQKQKAQVEETRRAKLESMADRPALALVKPGKEKAKPVTPAPMANFSTPQADRAAEEPAEVAMAPEAAARKTTAPRVLMAKKAEIKTEKVEDAQLATKALARARADNDDATKGDVSKKVEAVAEKEAVAATQAKPVPESLAMAASELSEEQAKPEVQLSITEQDDAEPQAAEAIEAGVVGQTTATETTEELPAEAASMRRFATPSTPVGAMAMQAQSEAVANICSGLSIAECVSSSACILQWQGDGKAYVCREPANDCEQSFIQYGNNQQLCETIDGCRFVPENCFCLPETVCDCSDGSPAMCVPDEGSPEQEEDE